jgi:hypothetical protein
METGKEGRKEDRKNSRQELINVITNSGYLLALPVLSNCPYYCLLGSLEFYFSTLSSLYDSTSVPV